MAWYDESVFYHIYPLGLTGAQAQNDYGEVVHRLPKLLPWIDHIKEIGCNAIYIGPLFESVGHGYETTDYRTLDRRLGDNDDLKEFVRTCHEKGVRVIFDGVFNHTGRDFFAFKDLQKNRENSQYKDWYCNVNFGGNNEYNDGFSYDNWGGYNLLVKLNQWNPQVKDYIYDVIRFWVSEFDIDGIRLDAADVLDFDFMKGMRQVANEVKPDFWLMGEIIHGDYKMWANPDMMHSVTNYECWKGIYSSHNDKNYFEIAHSLRRQFAKGGIYENLRLYNFLDNHDVNRIASLLKNPADLENAYTMLFCMPGIPSVYYGSEWGIAGVKTSGKEADLPVRPPIEEAEAAKRDTKLEKHIAALARLRQTTNALVYGEYADILVRNEQLVFVRQYNKEAVIAVFNIADTAVSLDFEWQGEKYAVELAPHDSRVIVKE